MPSLYQSSSMKFTKRIDLHCHSRASTEADEAMLEVIHCRKATASPAKSTPRPKSAAWISSPSPTTIPSPASPNSTAAPIVLSARKSPATSRGHLQDPSARLGITQADHDCLQAAARNIYEVAEYVAKNDLAHAVAHPLYRQNGVLNRTHIERLLLLFKGFECLNGAHSMSHRGRLSR